jgi:ABC-type transport system involved in multi-copper enzyme maturation permease subunit
MPTFLNWLLRLVITNPICMRLVQGGSKRMRHLYIRAGYLAVMIVVLVFALLPAGTGGLSMRDLAASGAQTFQGISYLQVALICLLTPIFMAGAIAQEANPRTWDIMLTTPLNSLQVVLGNLFGRLFFVLALLFSTLPLFVVTQYFGGVPGSSIFASYAIAGSSSLLVAAIAVTLSVTRTAGKRAVMLFYVTVVMYLIITYALDVNFRQPVGPVPPPYHTTLLTPLNPFLALEVLLQSNEYVPHDFTGTDAGWIRRAWFSQPISTFCWLCIGISVFLIAFSTMRLRVIGTRVGNIPWYRKLMRLGARGAQERPPRRVSTHPIAWRESVARGNTLSAILARWTFVAIGILAGIVIITLFHVGIINGGSFRLAIGSLVGAEIVVIALVALNMSATAVSREREDGTLDIILTTPIQPGPYIAGKLRGLIQFLVPMMLVPIVTMLLVSIYVLANGFGASKFGVSVKETVDASNNTVTLPVVLPEAAIALPLLLVPFVAFCVMVGLQWSIKSKGTIGSVIAAVGVVVAVVGVLSMCGIPMGNVPMLGAVVNTFSPINLLGSLVNPARMIEASIASDKFAARVALVIGAIVAGLVYAMIVYGMHTNMKKTFMQTVRRLAGAN